MVQSEDATVYVAARYGRREEMLEFANELTEIGWLVTSRWVLGAHGSDDGNTTRWGEYADDDVADMRAARWFILFTESEPVTRGSRLTELGYALAWGKKVIIVGPRENIFCHLPEIYRQYNSKQDLLRELGDNS